MNRLVDGENIVLKDADVVTSNRYNVSLLGDTYNALNMNYEIMPIEHAMFPNQAPSTAILPGKCTSFITFSFDISFHFMGIRECVIINSSHVFQ